MLEAQIELRLKWLEGFGYDVLKLRTPGSNGVPDRVILSPTWSPSPPAFVEIKQPGKEERALQAAIRDKWRLRGCDVRDMCDTIEKVQSLCDTLLYEAVRRYALGYPGGDGMLPKHIIDGYSDATRRLGVI